jgi:hypothetical protein
LSKFVMPLFGPSQYSRQTSPAAWRRRRYTFVFVADGGTK